MDSKTEEYLQNYLTTLTPKEQTKHTHFSVEHFCADRENANICSDLVSQGLKTATCSLKDYYQQTGEKRPEPGDLQVVTDWDGEPTSIIEIISVTECKFCDIDQDFAKAEGEGDQSLDWWRKVHREFFTNECKELNIKFSEDMILLQEHFRVVYK